MKDLEPSSPQEYILKGVVHCLLGQQQNNKEHIKVAQQFFQLVGSSPAECGMSNFFRSMCGDKECKLLADTIPGRQCMASAFFLQKQFEEVIVYLNSIKVRFFGPGGP